MRLKTKILIAAAAAFASTAAMAGFKQPQVVDVDLVSRVALGDMVSAQAAKDDVSFIGCGIRKISTGGGVVSTGFCQAGDADGETFTCFTQDPDLLDATSSTGDFSFITFAWNEDGECTRIGFSTQSFYLTKNMVK
ncbi:hypothetical protein [Hyphococcus sp.]|uniref:hypothetical protein n=1 Tax=Hyphococcus sp. TaxID=2038636 RepID=UPI00207E2399|nr:MAG: hypothetical protein DHS20C04_24170 [Marinicaulis sp.]